MVTLCQYDWSGNITEILQVPNEEMSRQWPGYVSVRRPVDIHNDWFDIESGEVRPRQPWEPQVNKTTINADGVDELIVSGLPVGTKVSFGTNKYTVNDGEFVLTTEAHGTGYVRIVPPGKQIRTVVFNALEL